MSILKFTWLKATVRSTRLIRPIFSLFIALSTIIAQPNLGMANDAKTTQTDATPTVFRIGTGGSEGTYLPIGSLIAQSVSGSNQHHKDAPYNEPSLFSVAQRSTGSVSNIMDISDGLLEAGLAQADVVYLASTGTGPFKNERPRDNLRFIATLYLESVHLIVRTDSNINNVKDLVDQRVSIDEEGSGTRLAMMPLLDAFGMRIDSLKPVYLKTSDAIDRLRKNELDAILLVAGYPVRAVSELIAEGNARIVSIDGPALDAISSAQSFFTLDSIPANTYENDEAIPTVGVAAQLITNSSMDENLVYNITSMLWSPTTLQLLSNGHPKGKDMQLQTALSGKHVAMHPGAARFYREQGLENDE